MKRIPIHLLLLTFLCLAGCSSSPTSPGSGGWIQATGGAPFSPRYGLSGTVFGGQMWVVGGAASDASASVTYWYGDVWSSSNGSSWTQATASAPFGGRYGSQVLSYNGLLWMIGGNQTNALKNDVWSSPDGANWTQVLVNQPGGTATHFSPREDFGAIVFNGAMWVIGGWSGTTKNDVWTSTDGITWTQVATTGGLTGRWGFMMTVYNNRLWIMGGATGGPNPTGGHSDVWSSPDGAAWTMVSNLNNFGNLFYSQATVLNNQILLTAGEEFTWGPRDYLKSSSDGITWAFGDPMFPSRFYHLGLNFNNQTWVIGGMNNITTRTYYNDVWHSP